MMTLGLGIFKLHKVDPRAYNLASRVRICRLEVPGFKAKDFQLCASTQAKNAP